VDHLGRALVKCLGYLDEGFGAGIALPEDDYNKAPVSEQDRVMLDYVVQVTRDATCIRPAHHDRLRAAGFDDRGILQITLIAAWFNYINRVADALGVGRE